MCIDNPNDGCDPNKGGADCGDICVSGPACGGIGGLQCPLKGTVCVDDPNDSCDPLTGGKDCIGICVTLPSQCGGTDNVQCPSTYTCTDPIANCTFSDIGNNCTGVCELTCGGYSAVNVPCPVGLTCKDDPSRPGCLLAADCTGICLKP